MTRLLDDDESLRAAYRAHGSELYRFAARALGDEQLAEEAVQETFLRAWKAGHRFDPSLASLRTWLFAIARNVIIDLGRARSARPVSVHTELPDAVAAGDSLEDAMVAWQVEEALRRISPDHRVVLIETYYRNRPYAEVADDLGVPQGTIKSRVYYALRSLRVALEEMGWADDGE